VRFGELLGILRSGQLGRLLLESHLLDPAPRRLELLIGGKPQLVGCAQLGGDSLETVARCGQRLLSAAARDQLRLQRLLDRRPVDLLALGRQLREQRFLLRNLRSDRLAPPGELGDALAARTLGESGFLRRTLCCPATLAPRASVTSVSFRACPARSRSAVCSPSRVRCAATSASIAAIASCSVRSSPAERCETSSAICARLRSDASATCFNCTFRAPDRDSAVAATTRPCFRRDIPAVAP
jgi:hypothetical protein